MSEFLQKLKQLIKELGSYQVSLYAANTSFYLILAFFPAIMLLLCLLPIIGFTDADLIRAVQSITPTVMHALIESIIKNISENSTGTLISVTAVVAVWSSSRSMYCIQQGLNAIYRVKESRNYLLRRIVCVLYMLLLIAALLLTFVMHGFGTEIANYFESKPIPILHFIVKMLRFRGLILFVLLTSLFTAFYCILPNRKVRLRYSLPGAALAALGWLLFTYFFSFYVRHSASLSVIYGSLASIAVGMLWLFICFSILFYGCIFNQFLEQRKQK